MPIHDSESEYLANAKARYRARKPVGRPSIALETIVIVDHAVQRMPPGELSQGAVMRATRDLYQALRKACHDDPECSAPSPRVLRQYVKAYLLYRLQGPAALAKFPPHLRRTLEHLPRWIHYDAMIGFAGTLPNGPVIVGDQQAVLLTKRIRAIPSLSK